MKYTPAQQLDLEIKIAIAYKNGDNTRKIATDLKISKRLINETFKKYNITPRNRWTNYSNDKLNYKFFDEINDEASAYFLGLMYADGCVVRNTGEGNYDCRYRLQISLQEEDRYILETFKNYIAPGYVVNLNDKQKNNPEWKQQYKLSFGDKTIANQLHELGCIMNKSLKLTYPHNKIPKNLEHHFIRGYFDGDGSIFLKKTPYKTGILHFVWDITSTKSFCDDVGIILNNIAGTTYRSMIANPKSLNQITSRLRVCGNQQIYRVMQYLYKDATIFLTRKHDKFLALEKQIKEQELKKSQTILK